MDVRELSQAVLEQRRLRGDKESTITMYRRRRRRFLDRYEDIAGSLEYDHDAVEQTLASLHRDVETGDLNELYFGDIRRHAADIDDMADFGVIGDCNLPSWGKARNILSRPLSDSVKNDPDSVVGLAARTVDLLAAKGVSSTLLYAIKNRALPRLVEFFEERGQGRYSEELMERYLEEIAPLEYELSQTMMILTRQAARHVKSVHDTGALCAKRGPGYVERTMTGPFGGLVREFEQWALGDADLAERTAGDYVYHISIFLEVLRGLGVEDLSQLTRETVRSARSVISGMLSRDAVRKLLTAVRSFARFAEQRHPELPGFGGWIGRGPKGQRRMPKKGYTREQSDAVTSSIDLASHAGARDLAITTLAKNTGLRACDILALRRSDIDWRARTITVTQSKTGRPLVLPLDTETGTAIASYLLGPRESRGECGDLVFLTVIGEAGPMSYMSLYKTIRDHAKHTLGSSYEGPHGTHSFRRGLGTGMAEAGVPLADVADMLGHSGMKSADPYVAVAFDRLRICAASLEAAPAEGIGWLR